MILVSASLPQLRAMIAAYLRDFQFDETISVLASVILCQFFPRKGVWGSGWTKGGDGRYVLGE